MYLSARLKSSPIINKKSTLKLLISLCIGKKTFSGVASVVCDWSRESSKLKAEQSQTEIHAHVTLKMCDKPFPWVEKGEKTWDKGYSNVINELLVVSIVEIGLIKRLGRLFKAQAWRKRIFTPKLMNLAKFRVSIGAPCLYQSEVSQTRDLYLETVRWWFSKIETVPHSVKIYPVFACGNARQFTKKILITHHVFTCALFLSSSCKRKSSTLLSQDKLSSNLLVLEPRARWLRQRPWVIRIMSRRFTLVKASSNF